MTEVAVAAGSGFRLSPQQRDLWRLGAAAERRACASFVDGALDPGRLREAVGAVVARHEILRTVYRSAPGLRFPVQVISANAGAAVQAVDLRQVGEERFRAEVERHLVRERSAAADLVHGPVLAVTLLTAADDRHALVLSLPAVAGDRPTLRFLLTEVARGLARAPGVSGDEPLQYADFAEWQNELLDVEEEEANRAYWRDLLATAGGDGFRLSQERPGELANGFVRGRLPLAGSCARLEALSGLARAEGYGLPEAVLAAWQLTLWRLGGGIPSVGRIWDGRKYEELEGVLGHCTHTVPVAFRPDPGRGFRELLREVGRSSEEGRSVAEYCNWDEVPEGDPASHRPHLRYLFEKEHGGEVSVDGLRFSRPRIEDGGERFRLKLTLDEEDGAPSLTLHYDASTFDAEGAAEIGESLEAVLGSIVATPGARLDSLTAVGPRARRRLVEEWNRTRRPFRQDAGIHTLVEEQASRSPDRIALSFAGTCLTYRELLQRADRLATELIARGVGREGRVALCLGRSLDLAVAVLAVLRAGGVYVPLDPGLPGARLASLLEGSGARVLLTHDGVGPRFEGFQGEVLSLDSRREGGDGPRHPGGEAPEVLPGQAAYVVFTSGSSGRPKGVVGHHGGAVSHLGFLVEEYGMGAADRALQVAPLSFDASIRDLLAPLTAGASVVLVPDADARDPGALLAAVDRERVTLLPSVVPSLLRAMVAAAAENGCRPRTLRTMLLSGERLYRADVRRAREVFGEDLTVVNQYGPTETTLTASRHRAGTGDPDPGDVPVGSPVANTRFFVVHAGAGLLPPGVAGELWIGGAGVARGYLGRPAETARRFVPDPFGAPGGRLYATGDLVRWLPGGEIDFLGRIDDQVKIRGNRVEPGEVEAALLEHDAVREVAVVARTDSSVEPTLVAYVVADRSSESAARELRAAVEARLPAYMVPAAFVVLEALPRTATGKIDRRALPAPRGGGGVQRHTPPRTVTEEVLAEIWAGVLDVERVGREDDFFELGGHSLLATQVVARVRKALRVELPLQSIFEHATLARLAAAVDAALAEGGQDQAPPLEPVPRDGDLPLSFAQQRLWLLAQLEPDSAAYNVATPIAVEGPLSPVFLARSLRAMVRRHETLRTTFHGVEGTPVQRVHRTIRTPLPLIDLSGLDSACRQAETRRLAVADARRSFDLSRGPVLRNALLRLGGTSWVLLLTVHHIVSDLWSAGVMVRELSQLYRASLEGRRAPLAELEVQYADFAAWQHRWLRQGALERLLAYWRERLSGMAPRLELPLDRPRPPVPTGRGGQRRFGWSSELVGSLRRLGRQDGATLFMVLLAAFQTLLHRYSGQSDLAVGTAAAGRQRVETEPLIGFFVNTLVLRTDLTGDPSFRGLLGRVVDTVIGAHAHQDLPFERLVQEVDPERDLSRSPLVQGLFVLQSAPRHALPEEALEIPGLTVRRLELGRGVARFDFDFMVWERDGGLDGLFEYDADLFDATTIDRLTGQLGTLAAAVLDQPDRPVSGLSILSGSERHQLLAEWNDSGVSEAAERSHAEIARVAARVPDRPAVADDDAVVTYGELVRRADRLARELAAVATEPEPVVALLGPRGVDLVTAVLGVLSAGGAFLPLDPEHPSGRLAGILDRSGCRTLVVLDGAEGKAGEVLERVPAPRRPRILELSGGRIGVESPPRPLPAPEPENLAYVLYTSGSTGAPKGAMVSHRGMSNHLGAKVRDCALGSGDVVAQTASQSFDISVWQSLAALLVGGSVRVVPDRDAHDPARLLESLDRHRVTVVETVPSLLGYVLEEAESATGGRPTLAALRWLIPTGEALPPELCRRWLSLYPGIPLVNAYGPTECSDDVTHHRVRRGPPEGEARVPIGRPVANTRLEVLDSHMRLLPPGAVGTLYIGGVGVGRGYLGAPVRTADVFVPDPFAAGPGSRLYDSGDRVRQRPDGTLEFLGRVDHQVKLRGFRLELEEIEAALRAHPEVGSAAVVMTQDEAPGGAELAAFVTRDAGRTEADGDRDGGVVEEWGRVFDDVYRHGSVSERDAAVHRRVWISSYTGQPLPDDEILECVEDSVARIRALAPERVLEIGCGSGLLLSRLAPACRLYHGTDLSAAAVRSLQESEAGRGGPGAEVVLELRAAHDFSGLPERSFDVVLLNEVVQYFPSGAYLEAVLEGAVDAAADGGRVFVGGVRSLPLLEAFHASVQLTRAPAELPGEELRRRFREALAQEKELAVDPRLFAALTARLGRVGGVRIELKGGRAGNELTRFRYDVVLAVGEIPPPGAATEVIDWDRAGLSLEALRDRLEARRDLPLEVRRIPNARVSEALQAAAFVREAGAPAGEVRAAVEDARDPAAVEPEGLRELGARLGLDVSVRWCPEDPGRVEALFTEDSGTSTAAFYSFGEAAESGVGRGRLTNTPVQDHAHRELPARLREWLRGRLPETVVPARYRVLDALPLTPNGKIDRVALAAAVRPEDSTAAAKAATRTPAEELLASLWTEVLGVERVGRNDDFFRLGGHSLLATRLISRARRVFGVELPLRALFEAPTLRAMAARLEAERESSGEPEAPPVRPVPRTDALALSFGQQRLWFLAQLDPDDVTYNVPAAVRLSGRLDLTALGRSLEEIVRRHEVLRTTFGTIQGRSFQRIHPPGPVTPVLVDLTAVPPAAREEAAGAAIAAQLLEPFDLERGPLLRSHLFRLGDEEHVLLLVLHHIVSDGWSMEILVREMSALYSAFTQGAPSPLEGLPIQYADFAHWQRSWLQGPALERRLEYWRRQLSPLPAVLALPTDRPRTAERTPRGAGVPVELAPEVWVRLQGLARDSGVTAFMLLLAGFQALLHRYGGQDEFAVGTPVAGRTRLETEGLIGFLVNTLVLRADLSGDPGFRELLERTREVSLDAHAHQDLPFEKLVEELQPERSLGHSPVFQVVFVLQDTPAREVTRLPGLRLEGVEIPVETAKFDLTLTVQEMGDGVRGSLLFSRDLFDTSTVERMGRHLESLFRSIAEHPERRLSRLSLLDPAERRELLAGGREATSRVRPPAARLDELVRERAEASPDAVAVVCEEVHLSYRELVRRSALLAGRLRALGVGPEARVAILAERSEELVVAILATLRAGGAYLPVDPSQPAERLGYLVADSKARAVLLGRRLDARAAGVTVPVLSIAADSAGPEAEPASPLPGASPGAAAYVIYTSGSTGEPKGVVVSHDNVVRLLRETEPWFGFGPEDAWTLFHSSAFDFSVWELWGALVYGGRLVVVPYLVSRSPEDFRDRLRRERVTVLNQTPAAFRQLIRACEDLPDRGHELALRWVVFGGEALEFETLRPWFDRWGDRVPRLVNMYGITETTVHVTYRPVTRHDVDRGGSAIGGPIPDLDLHVLDPGLEPVPAGVPGELFVAGAGLARGYLMRPGLTAERFVPNPFGGRGGDRLYRSGDRVRRLSRGDVEYLGRTDHQVKVRGFRIEPGEIESLLLRHPSVHEAVVLARPIDPEGSELAAFVVGNRLEERALREHLATSLPPYMIPARILALPELPLTRNGKLDRAALLATVAGPAAPTAAAWAATTPVERRIAAIWEQVLERSGIGASDSFFDLGGDSIKAVRLVSRINEELAADLRVKEVFQYQTVERLAARVRPTGTTVAVEDERAAGLEQIDRLRGEILDDPALADRLPEDWEDVYPLSSIEKGMIYYSLLLPDEPVYHDQYAYLLSIESPDRFARALELLAGRHPVLRSGFHLYGFPEPVKVVHRRLPPGAWQVEDLRALPRGAQLERIRELRSEELASGFTFEGELLWRLRLFDLGGGVYCGVWSWHHAILDGWSNVSFWTEMNELMRRQDLEEIEALEPLAATYKDYVALALGRGQSEEARRFWRRLLAGHERNRLPFQRGGGEAAASGMLMAQRRLDAELLEALRQRAREGHLSLQALCLAAHVYLLHVTSGDAEVLTGVVSNDRPGIEDGDRILGCFLTTLPMRVRVDRAGSWLELARTLQQALTEAKAHELSLADVAALVEPAGGGRNPFFDTLFNYMDFHVLEGVEENRLFRPMASEEEVAGFDLQSSEMTNTLFDLEVATTLGRLTVKIKYSPAHFSADDVERCLDLYRIALRQIAEDPARGLDPQALVSAEERRFLLEEFNATAGPFPADTPLHRFFERRARELPDQPAVRCGRRSLTYGELDQQANRLAHRLLSEGVRPGEPVGVVMERSVELVAALLGVLKAGCSYVPSEPGHPAARKGYLFASSGVRCVLADRAYEIASPGPLPRVLVPEPEELAALDSSAPAIETAPGDLAYTIYTSGSTGRPKGVMIDHRAAANLVHWVNEAFAVGPSSRVLMVSSVCFDLSVYDLFGALAAGATVVIARSEEVENPARLAALMAEAGVTFWNSVPSTLGMLVRFLEDERPELPPVPLSTVFLSGDWIPLTLPSAVRRCFPDARVVSLGGATEGTVWSIFHEVEEVDPAWPSVPYGRPIANTSFYVVDPRLRVVPVGVVGELVFGGVGVAKGYAAEPVKTAVAFVPDPFSPTPGATLYRTGDLGRMLPEGRLEFLGRQDHQVKVRGYRVELGEIESQLSRHPGIGQAAVVARTDAVGEKYLVAYVVSAEEVPQAEIEKHLAQTLPGYMIPSTIVRLESLPLTSNGKVDRRALPEPGTAEAGVAVLYVAPRDEEERVLVEVWEEVLEVPGIGVEHDFFDLGGHSLTAVRMVSRIRQRFGVALPLGTFFEAPTVARLAALVRAAAQPVPAGAREAIRPARRPERLPLSHAQERLWFLERFEPGNPAFHLGGAVRLAGRLEVAVLARAVDEIVRRHESLRTVFAEADGRPVQVVGPPAPHAVPLVDLGGLPQSVRERELRRFGREEGSRPFDLARGPLLRTLLVRLAAEEHVVLFAVHHMVSDGWSMGVLTREVGDLYQAFAAGRSRPLPPLPIQYADYALWQQRWLESDEARRQLDYWRRQLAGALPRLELPMQRPRPARPSLRGGTRSFTVRSEVATLLAELGRSRGASLFMVLLSAFKALLHLYTGEEDLLVGTNGANRDREETEGLIGFLVNDLVLRTDLSGGPSFLELLDRVRQVSLEAFDHAELPFERVLQALQPERAADVGSTLFQVMFVLQNFPLRGRELPGIQMTPVPLEQRSAPFDLTLMVGEAEDGLVGSFIYQVDRFPDRAMERMTADFSELLEIVAADPEVQIQRVRLGREAERAAAVDSFNEAL